MKFHQLLIFMLLISGGCIKQEESKSLTELPEERNKTLSVYDSINLISKNDKKLNLPAPGDWRTQFKEDIQTFDDFRRLNHNARDSLKVIYIYPIGDFDSLENQLLIATKNYLSGFYNRRIEIIPYITPQELPEKVKRNHHGYDQILAPYILYEILEQDNPSLTIIKLAITDQDIYPKESWNYVFGLANYKKRVGVSSFHRFREGNLNEYNFTNVLSRLIKTSSHEINHMLKIQHCVAVECLMNGANNINELDSRPNRLCTECLAKLTWSLGLNLKDRMRFLNRYFLENRLHTDLYLISQDLEILKEIN